MSQRAATWGDVLRHRSGFRLVGRRREVEIFRLNCLYDVPQSLLFLLQGPHGIGKTELLMQYCAIAEEHSVVTAVVRSCDLRVTGRHAAIEAMAAIARQLTRSGVPLTTFQEVYVEYENASQAIAEDRQAPEHAWALFGGLEDEDEWVRRAWDDYLISTAPVRRSQLIQDPVGVLTERFVQDLNAWATVRKIVIGFDDWHLASPALDVWLLDLITQGILSTNIWFVMASPKMFSRGWEGLSPVTATVDLEPLSPSESRALLLANGVSDPMALEQCLDLGQGHPLSLLLLASIDQNLSLSGEETAVGRYLALVSPKWREVLLKCAAARHLDSGVLSVLLNVAVDGELQASEAPVVEVVERAEQFFRRSPLANASPMGWRFHPGVVEELVGWARSISGETWQDAHERLHAYYRQRLELHSAQDLYRSPDWQRDQAELLYHGLLLEDLELPRSAGGDRAGADRGGRITRSAASGKPTGLARPAALAEASAGVNAALLSFSQALLRFTPWAGTVLRVWREAARLCDPAGSLATWLAEAEALSDALFAGDWEPALTLLDDFLSAPGLSPEVLQPLRNLQRLTASRLALPPDGSSSVDPVTDDGPIALAKLEASESAEHDSTAYALPSDSRLAREGNTATVSSELSEEGQEVDGPKAPAEKSAVEHCSYANARLRAGDLDAAIQAYDQALALNPEYVAAFYNRGLAYARMGALDSALVDFTRVTELDPEQGSAYYQRGLAFTRKGALENAVADYDVALSLRPRTLPFIYARANAYFRLRGYERAIGDYTAVLAQDATRVNAFLNRGLARAAIGDYAEALRDYNQAIALDPERAVAYSHRGQAYVDLGRYSEALADYERAVSLDPRNAAVHNNLGLLYARIDARPQAIEAYKQSMALQPDWATPYYNAACAAAVMEEVDQACIWLSRAVALRARYRVLALTDPDFAAIRDSAQFRLIVEAADTGS